ncbi:MBL fold metallo-hydrolase [Pseudemcibacter aquimaris]|uniref:MBL fold metallo-hydrolase n=1 Tax=Pseudemcibacter aquimaris TaxID=2857064 RepID=UPI002011D93C|nr:MBL fold metallo-hydrolase [Pseudemcibacter aquimaris]MCC3859692.1 MBL fold metallo-hydrolase [Pseudemcibacter aquimaris]WDU60087.1 MBL fold metallo-hydrolase [Pseudemcibacter aquimaris]
MLKSFLTVLVTFFISQHAIAEGLKVVILGTGTPVMKPERSGPGVAVLSGGKAYIVDSGAGMVRKAIEASKTHPELKASNLDMLFLTHLHSDHTAGLSNMILAPWVLRREHPLKLFGPPGSKHMADTIISAYSEDIDMRINGSQPANLNGYKVETTEFSASGTIFEDDNVIVEAIKVPHGSWEHAYGYKFTEKSTGKTAVISGDTAYSEAIIDAATDADILVHEIISERALSKRSEEWQIYHKSFHTLPSEIADIANKAKPRVLVLYHQLYWDEEDNRLAEEVMEAGYNGKIVSANDLDVFQ